MKKSTLLIMALVLGMAMSAQVLVSNGPFVTHPGQGAGGANYSAMDTNLYTYAAGILGFRASNTSTGVVYRVADDFTIPASTTWSIDSIIFYGYQTGASTTSTITQLDFVIWNGLPDQSTIVYGDTTMNLLDQTSWANCYRGVHYDLLNVQRPIMRVAHNLPGTQLGPGTYYLDWRYAGTLTSGPWANPIAIPNQAVTGDAMQKGGTAWNNIMNNGNGQGLPFVIKGTVVGSVAENGGVVNMNVWPNPVTENAQFGINLANGANISDFNFAILDVLGKEVVRMDKLTSGHFTVNCIDLPAGVYVYQLSNASGVVHSDKFNVVK